jgi:hypothetical protein
MLEARQGNRQQTGANYCTEKVGLLSALENNFARIAVVGSVLRRSSERRQ